jgi:RNA polymerase sigma-70 factor (ECF subfamily)
VRAKRKIRDAVIPLSMPVSLDERIDAVLGVLYLVFNEGYLSRGAGDDIVRVDLTEEATRLTELVAELLPEHPEVEGLLALQLYHRARLATPRCDR